MFFSGFGMHRTIVGLVVVCLVAFFVIQSVVGESDDNLQYNLNVQLSEGWNLIPAVCNSGIPALESAHIQTMYVYNIDTKDYTLTYHDGSFKNEDVLKQDSRYFCSLSWWVYATEPSTFSYTTDRVYPLSEFELKTGWNFLFIRSEMIGKSLWESKGTCNIEKVYAWSRDGNPSIWNKLDIYQRINPTEAIGLAIILKVNEGCKLASSNQDTNSPPPLPGENDGGSDLSYKCTETDNGLDYYNAGAVYFGKYDYVDSCANPGIVNAGTPQEYTLEEGDLVEYACYGSDNVKRCSEHSCRFIKYHCPKGCNNGACVP